jgi:signal transduction histidine kinase
MNSGAANHPELSNRASSQPHEWRLYEAIEALTSELSLELVLQKVTDLSRDLAQSSYSALGVLGGSGKLTQFLTSGISQDERDRIGGLPEGKGVLGLLGTDNKPIRLPDLSEHPQSVGFPPNHPAMKSFLGVPIVYKGRVLGNIYLANKIGAEEFSEDDESLLSIFAAQSAIAIENARLFENESRRSTQLDVLNRAGRELALIPDLGDLLRAVADLLKEGFSYENVQVFWVDQANSTLQLRALVGLMEDKVSLGGIRPMDQGISGWAAKHRQTVVSNDVSNDPRYDSLVDGATACSNLAVPVTVKEQVVAVINVEGMEPDAFDDSDVKTLETLADQLAVAVENIQLHRQQRDQSRSLAVAEERDRIGRDLHDGVIQSIYAAGLTLEDIASRADEEPQEVRPRIDSVVGDLNQSIADIRSYIMDLRPRELQGRGLDEALASLVRYLEDRTGVKVKIDVPVDMSVLSEQYAVNLWHVFQEAFSNIEKYANATTVTLSLTISEDTLTLDIADDGVGFDLETAELGRGYGLPNIKDRAERLGGMLLIESALGQGTWLKVLVPMGYQATRP